MGYYPIYFIGKVSDTLCIGLNRIREYDQGKQDTIRHLNKIAQLPDSASMRIVVDTTFTFPLAASYVDANGKEYPDSTTYYKSIAVLIYNLADKPLHVAHFSELPYTVRQTRDSRGNWVDVELPISYFSKTGAQPKFIHPGQVLVAKALLHKGELKRECRLKLQRENRIVYSNTYIDYIDKDQLEKPLEKFWN